MNPKFSWPLLALSCAFVQSVNAGSQPTKPVITLESAKAAVSSIEKQASGTRESFVISIVDDGGYLIYLERSDGVASGMVEASIRKAKTAAMYGFTTKALEEQVVQGHPGFQQLPEILPMEGGVPVVINGRLAGAIGVAGGMSSDDGVIATETAARLGSLAPQQ